MAIQHRKLFINKRKRILKQILVGLSLFLFGSVTLYGVSSVSKKYFHSLIFSDPVFAILLMSIIAIAVYKPLDYIFAELFNRILFKKKSYVHIVLMNLAEELETVLDLQELSNLVVNTFGEILHLKTVALLASENKGEPFRIVSAFGWNITDCRRVCLAYDSTLVNFVRANGAHVLVRNRAVRNADWQEANRLAHDFDNLYANWIIPLVVKDEVIGLLAFAANQQDRVFDETDFHFFRRFANSIAKKVYNALFFLKLKRANLQLQDAQSKLVQTTKLAAIEQLATGLAHQIHNPLTIISGKAQILLLQKDRAPLNERVQEVLKTIVKQTKRAADITKKLLMFSQGSGMQREPLYVEQVLEDTLALISYQTSLDQIKVSKSIGTMLPVFHGNVHEVREIFFNLLLNAVQSVGPGGKVHVDINYQAKEDVMEIQISDTGRGIEKDHIEKLFNPFFTTRDDALGLGLFVTKQIVHRYGGSIRVESRVGEGSLFIVRLPCSTRSQFSQVQSEAPVSLETHQTS